MHKMDVRFVSSLNIEYFLGNVELSRDRIALNILNPIRHCTEHRLSF